LVLEGEAPYFDSKTSVSGTFDAVMVNYANRLDTFYITDGKFYFSNIVYAEAYW
jgi:hypothetical protein